MVSSLMGKRGRSSRNDSGSLLAAVFILAMGAGCCLFTVSVMSPSSLFAASCTVGVVIGGFLILVILQRFGKLPQNSLSFLVTSQRSRRDDGAADYQPRKVGEGQDQTSHGGTNRPISAEEAHDIKVTSLNTWVPSPGRGRKK